jgi:hypothetical protein
LKLAAPKVFADGGKIATGVAEIYRELGRETPEWGGDSGKAMADLLALRGELRRSKDFTNADLLRKKLEGIGVTLKDGTSDWVIGTFSVPFSSDVSIQPSFHWNAIPGAINYEIEVSSFLIFAPLVGGRFTSAVPTIIWSGPPLASNNTYFYRVRAVGTTWEYKPR